MSGRGSVIEEVAFLSACSHYSSALRKRLDIVQTDLEAVVQIIQRSIGRFGANIEKHDRPSEL